MNSSWVVQPVKNCIKHYTYKNSHILWMSAVHHNFVVTFLQHKFKKLHTHSLSHTHTHTHRLKYRNPSIQAYTIQRVVHGTEFHEARREWSHPQGSPSSSRLNATRWGRQSKEVIIRSTGASYWITTYQKFYYFTGSNSHTLQTTSEDRSVIFILQMRKLRHNEPKQHLSWVTQQVGELSLNPDLYDSRAVVFFIILCCLCKEGATEI